MHVRTTRMGGHNKKGKYNCLEREYISVPIYDICSHQINCNRITSNTFTSHSLFTLISSIKGIIGIICVCVCLPYSLANLQNRLFRIVGTLN